MNDTSDTVWVIKLESRKFLQVNGIQVKATTLNCATVWEDKDVAEAIAFKYKASVIPQSRTIKITLSRETYNEIKKFFKVSNPQLVSTFVDACAKAGMDAIANGVATLDPQVASIKMALAPRQEIFKESPVRGRLSIVEEKLPIPVVDVEEEIEEAEDLSPPVEKRFKLPKNWKSRQEQQYQ